MCDGESVAQCPRLGKPGAHLSLDSQCFLTEGVMMGEARAHSLGYPSAVARVRVRDSGRVWNSVPAHGAMRGMPVWGLA